MRQPRCDRSLPTILAAAALVVAGTSCAADTPLTQQRAEVAERGAQVMPFDLEATTHVFTKTAGGGVQVVTADDPTDQEQIELIRTHLSEERSNFTRGDFDDPAEIHGHDMPGVAELTAGYAEIDVTYAETPAGAQLTYTTDDPQLVDAVHAWFDRQVMDHGDDAKAG
jgi:hypothetical protein